MRPHEVWLSNTYYYYSHSEHNRNKSRQNIFFPFFFLLRLKNSWLFECRPHTAAYKCRGTAGLQTATISMTQQTFEVKNFSSFGFSGMIKTQSLACEMAYYKAKPPVLWTACSSSLDWQVVRNKNIWLGWKMVIHRYEVELVLTTCHIESFLTNCDTTERAVTARSQRNRERKPGQTNTMAYAMCVLVCVCMCVWVCVRHRHKHKVIILFWCAMNSV